MTGRPASMLVTLTTDDLRALVRDAVEPLRLELERLRAVSDPVTQR
jgi:hypothetical protein